MRLRPKKQIYSKYTAEDFRVWKLLFERQMHHLEGRVAQEFMHAIEAIGFNAEEIPNFKEVNKKLAQATSWKLVTVQDLSPAKEFFQHLANKEFTATCWLRKMEELDYLEEPDMFHDVFAHTPLLINSTYTDFFQSFGRLALQYIDYPEIVTKLQRLYWFTIEFGLIRNQGELKIYGAGIISSKEETYHSLSKDSIKHEYDVAKIFAHDFRTDILQDEYYVIDSFEQLTDSFPTIEQLAQESHESIMALN